MQKKEIKPRKIKTTSSFASERVLSLHVRENTEQLTQLHERHLTLLFQQSTSPVKFKVDGKPQSLEFEQAQLISPKKFSEISAPQGVFNFFVMFFEESAVNEAIAENKLSKSDQQSLQKINQKLPMTPWLKSLLRQYFYETVIMLDSPPGCTFFLEKQIINEVMRCVFSNYHMKNGDQRSVDLDSQMFEVVKHMESRLYEEQFSIASLASEVGMSESSLLRKFKAALGLSPQSYIKNRRLEDAYGFIKEHGMSVSEACFMVGYSDFASFSKSFKAKFGVLPSHL